MTFYESRLKPIPALIIMPFFGSFFGVILHKVIRAVAHGSPIGNSWIGFLVLLVPFLICCGLEIYYVLKMLVPGSLTVNARGAEIKSIWQTRSLLWSDYGTAKLKIKYTGKSNRSYYALLPAKTGDSDAFVFIGGYAEDYDNIIRCMKEAQGGRIVDVGDPSVPFSLIFGYIPFTLGFVGLTAWWIIHLMHAKDIYL